MTDEYELMPADELAKLRSEVDRLKANPFGKSEQGKTLQDSVEALTVAINKLIKIFSDVEADFLNENQSDSVEILNELRDQNEKIAAGIVTVADMIKETPATAASPQEHGLNMPPPPQVQEPAMPSPQSESLQESLPSPQPAMPPPQIQDPFATISKPVTPPPQSESLQESLPSPQPATPPSIPSPEQPMTGQAPPMPPPRDAPTEPRVEPAPIPHIGPAQDPFSSDTNPAPFPDLDVPTGPVSNAPPPPQGEKGKKGLFGLFK